MPRAVVVTMMLADCPALIVPGLTEQVVACAGDEQVATTCPVNPLRAVTAIALLKVAVCPAMTVCDPCPAATVNEKSGGPVTVKFTELEDSDMGVRLTTVIG